MKKAINAISSIKKNILKIYVGIPVHEESDGIKENLKTMINLIVLSLIVCGYNGSEMKNIDMPIQKVIICKKKCNK